MTDRPGETRTTYIGDGVYASTDGYSIILHTYREVGPPHVIFLDSTVWQNLTDYYAMARKGRNPPSVPDIGPAGFGDNPYLEDPNG